MLGYRGKQNNRVAATVARNLTILGLIFSFAGAAAAQKPVTLRGVILDPADEPVALAAIMILNAQGIVLRETVSDAEGNFAIAFPDSGAFILRVQAPHFATRGISIASSMADGQPLRIRLELAVNSAEVTVTAVRGNVENALSATQLVILRERDYLVRQPLATLGGALDSTPGIMIQETTYGQSSPYMRGLTGYETLLLVDGIRFNTSIFRSGPNQYLSFVNPGQVERVEAVLGPASSMYGSDSMGGTINLLTPTISFRPDQSGSRLHGDLSAMGASADASGTADAHVFFGGGTFSMMGGGTFRRLNNLRGGAGMDSRNAFRRYLGLSPAQVRDLLGSRMRDTGFTQTGADTRTAWSLSADQSLSFQYIYSGIKGERSYRDQLGGLGLTIEGLARRDRVVFAKAQAMHIPVAVTLAGGYARRLEDTVLIHTNTVRVAKEFALS